MVKVNKKAESSKTSQIVTLVGILFCLIAVSVTTMLIATDTVEVFAPDAPPIHHMSEAEAVCGKRVKNDQGRMLNAFSVDDRSSFFDDKTGEFKLFYEMEVFNNANKQSGVKKFYINCVVASEKGVIDRMEYLEEVDFKPKAIKREHGNAFGF